MQPGHLALPSGSSLSALAAEIGCGRFEAGLLSVLSEREDVRDLGGWEKWLPPDAILFASTAFGNLFALSGGIVWVVDVQEGEVFEADVALEPFMTAIASDRGLSEELRAPQFRRWLALSGDQLGPTEILCPTPIPALGGDWTISSFRKVSLPVVLSMTAQTFAGDKDLPIIVNRANRE